jgi:hypothetical protein
VVRSALPKKVKRCNAIGAPYAVGMRAAIEGAWQTDLRPGIPAEPSHYQRAFTGIIQQFVQNESDVRAYNVRAIVFNGSSGTKVTVGQSGDAAGTNISGLCTRAPGSNTETVCTYDSIAPHERKNILIRYEYTPTAGLPFDHDGIRVDLRVLTDSPDSNSSNNVSEQSIFFCAPTSKFTGCDKAT